MTGRGKKRTPWTAEWDEELPRPLRRALELSKRARELPWQVGRGLRVQLQERPGSDRIRALLDFTDAPSQRALREAVPHLMRWVRFLEREQGASPGTPEAWRTIFDLYARPKLRTPGGRVVQGPGMTHPQLATWANKMLHEALMVEPPDEVWVQTFLRACGLRGRKIRSTLASMKSRLRNHSLWLDDWPITSDHIEAALRSYRRRERTS